MKYACLKNQQFIHHIYQITPLRRQDIFLIKEWRNEQMDILRQNVLLTDGMQEAYFENIIKPSFASCEPNQIIFSYLENGQLIGYGGIVHIDWKAKEAEVSFLVATQRAKNTGNYQEDFTSFLKLIKEVAFHDLHFHRLYTETFDIRPQHLLILERAGFVLEKRLKNSLTLNGKLIDALIHGYRQHD
jgi:RimJ/RimL family protein N-acetyltransferase